MPPVFLKPHAQAVETVTESAETETETGLDPVPLDLSDIINNTVANFKLHSDSKHTKRKRKVKFPCGIREKKCEQKSNVCAL